MGWFKVGTRTGTACDGVGGNRGGEEGGCWFDLGVLQYGVGGHNWGLRWGRWAGRSSFLSGDGLRYGPRRDHVQQVLSLPVC